MIYQIKFFHIYSLHYAEACNEFAWQIFEPLRLRKHSFFQRNFAAVASRWQHCVQNLNLFQISRSRGKRVTAQIVVCKGKALNLSPCDLAAKKYQALVCKLNAMLLERDGIFFKLPQFQSTIIYCTYCLYFLILPVAFETC